MQRRATGVGSCWLALALAACAAGPDAARTTGTAGHAQAIAGADPERAPAAPGGDRATQGVADERPPAPARPDARPEPSAAPAPPTPPEPASVDPHAASAAPPAQAHGVHADLDPDNDSVVGPPEPLEDCEARLEAAGITWKKARIGVGRKVDGIYTCGAKQVVRFVRGPGKIAYSSSPLLTCTMALALADFERIAQEEAERIVGSKIKSIDHIGTYNCRSMVAYDLISEHSFANGIDLAVFHFKNGDEVSVKKFFRPTQAEATDRYTRFLRALGQRLYDEGVFSTVVTPYFDQLHHNHIHVDLARYRVDGSRP